LAKQSLGAGFAVSVLKMLQVFRIIYVERDSGESQRFARFPGCLSSGQMRFEAVISETQRK
jgi:hypothetical protein